MLRVSKSLIVGGFAALVDFASLSLLVRLCNFSPLAANMPSLLLGSLVQFLGNRNYVFKATQGLLMRQILLFSSAEIGAFLLNAVGFHLLITYTKIYYLLARLLISALIFICFSYPAWKRVFQPLTRDDHS